MRLSTLESFALNKTSHAGRRNVNNTYMRTSTDGCEQDRTTTTINNTSRLAGVTREDNAYKPSSQNNAAMCINMSQSSKGNQHNLLDSSGKDHANSY